jgi:acyl-coenzyme A synthetase/AMP-(fatty) acid ligase
VTAAAVVATGDSADERRLVGFVVPTPQADPDALPGRLHEFLTGRIPGYMVPGRIELVAALPLTGNGKVDRGTLTRMSTPPPSRPERGA